MISLTKEQIYIVTGASSGLGEATALLSKKFRATVISITRNILRLNSLKEKYGKFSGIDYLLSDKLKTINGQDFILDTGGVL